MNYERAEKTYFLSEFLFSKVQRTIENYNTFSENYKPDLSEN